MNQVVARYQNGRVLKGFTNDFLPTKSSFHVTPVDAPGTWPVDISVPELKALFFVKDFVGNSDYNDCKEFEPSRSPSGRRINVVFKDGETLVGTTQGYQPGRPGFFLVPADPQSNTERCFVVSAATHQVAFVV